MQHSFTALPERRQQRLSERKELQRLRTFAKGTKAFPKGEQRDRHVAIVYLTTLPTRQLLATYRAAKTQFDPTSTTFP